MFVKTVFKWIIGTAAAIVFLSIMMEVYNISITGFEILRLVHLSTRKACDLYCMETYKREDIKNINLPDVIDSEGNVAVSGNFYGDKSTEEIYNEFYKNNEEFKNWALENNNYWKNLRLLSYGLGFSGGEDLDNEERQRGRGYVDKLVTPLNLGILYLKPDVIENITRWNIASIMSVGKPVNIKKEGNRKYVLFNGFRVYIDSFKIDSIDYKVVNVVDNPERFKLLTNLDADKLGYDASEFGGEKDDRCNVNVAFIKYSVDIGYEGVTPLKRVISFALSGGQGLNVGGNTSSQLGSSVKLLGGYGRFGDSLMPERLVYYLIQ